MVRLKRERWTSEQAAAISCRVIPVLVAGCFCVAFLLAWGANWLALIPWRGSVGQHWTERARLLHPARKAARSNLCLITGAMVFVGLVVDPTLNILVTAVPALLGALLGGYPMSRELFPETRFKSWLHLVLATLLLVLGFWLVILIGALAMPEHFGLLTWIIAGTVLFLQVAFLSGLGIRLLRWLRLLKPAPESLQVLVREMSQKMQVAVRATWVLATHLSNAAALPLARQLVFTAKLLATHPDDEIKAICAHELGHLNESRKVIFVRTLVALSLFPLIFLKPVATLIGLTDSILLLSLPVLVLLLVGFRLGRRMEKRADRIAVKDQFVEPAVYAKALERLYQTNLMPAVLPRRAHRIHPDLYDRMLAAGVTPDFPKPAPAKSLSWSSYLAAAGLLAVLMLAFLVRVLWVVWHASPDSSLIDAGGG